MNNKITINDIARLANVSKTTVSFYLNGRFEKMSADTKERIATAIRKTGYQPSKIARSLNFKPSQLIGVVIGDITNSFANQIVKGIETCTRENGYQLILGSSDYQLNNEIQCVNGMLSMGVDGLIVQPTTQFCSVWQSRRESKPLVYFDSPNHNTAGSWVKTNNYEAVYDAADLLVARGYRRFIIVTAEPSVLVTRQERNQGFIDNLELRGLPYVRIIADNRTAVPELQSQIEANLPGPGPVCVFACNNWLLSKVYLALEPHREEIPDQLGLIGFDSTEWTELARPAITTIVQPAYDEGYIAGKILLDQITGSHDELPNQILKCKINELASTRRQDAG